MLYRVGCFILVAGVPAFAWERLNSQVGYCGAGLFIVGLFVSMYGSRLLNR